MRASLPDTEQGRSVYEAVKRECLMQMSFDIVGQRQTVDKEKRECTVAKIAAVYEISIVNLAPYPQTTLQARSQTINAGKEENTMNTTFNPIESAVLNPANVNPDPIQPRNTAAHFTKSYCPKN
ncbi:MAG: HK97 family phage prohead protease [Christensenella sp.]